MQLLLAYASDGRARAAAPQLGNLSQTPLSWAQTTAPCAQIVELARRALLKSGVYRIFRSAVSYSQAPVVRGSKFAMMITNECKQKNFTHDFLGLTSRLRRNQLICRCSTQEKAAAPTGTSLQDKIYVIVTDRASTSELLASACVKRKKILLVAVTRRLIPKKSMRTGTCPCTTRAVSMAPGRQRDGPTQRPDRTASPKKTQRARFGNHRPAARARRRCAPARTKHNARPTG